MKLTPNENVLRVALIIFSILFGLLSISLIALGAVYIDELWWPRKYVGLDFLELPTLLIILGSLSLVMSLAGCYCAKSYNRRLLQLFGLILSAILCIELAVAVIALINFDKHDTKTSHTKRIMEKHTDEPFFQRLQDHYQCCGITGTEDYCLENNPILQKVGCPIAVDKQLQSVSMEIGYFAIILAILQGMEVAYVVFICKLMNKNQKPSQKLDQK